MESLRRAIRITGPRAAKRLMYGQRGEPHAIGGHTLRFMVGTRPHRLKYATAAHPEPRYDALQQLYLAKHLKPGDYAIDIGAHCGQDSLIMAALCGSEGEVVACEPNMEGRELFARNVALNTKVKPPTLIAAAVSDHAGTGTLFLNASTSTRSSLSVRGTGQDDAAGYDVPLVTLDGWMTRLPDLVKIDVEGFELHVLRGATKVLASNAHILCELHPFAWPSLGESLDTLKALLRPYGRRVRYLDALTEATEAHYGIALLERA